MSYTQFPTSTTDTNSSIGRSSNQPKNNNNKIIIAALLIALLGTWAYIIYDKSKVKEDRIQYVDRIM
ncbi:MAG: hypothetical protein H3C56_00160 [Chitinophagaceae bacterium]|nr:hypothetical protein [Chitinophagaceae bacterium]